MQRSFNARLLCGWGYSLRPTKYLLLTTHHSPLTAPHSPLTTHHSPLTTHCSPLTTHYRWDALDSAYASECVPDGMEGLGLRAVSNAGVEELEAA